MDIGIDINIDIDIDIDRYNMPTNSYIIINSYTPYIDR